MIVDQPDGFGCDGIIFIDNSDPVEEVANHVRVREPDKLAEVMANIRQSFKVCAVAAPHLPQTLEGTIPV
jgi:hypothetical protein